MAVGKQGGVGLSEYGFGKLATLRPRSRPNSAHLCRFGVKPNIYSMANYATTTSSGKLSESAVTRLTAWNAWVREAPKGPWRPEAPVGVAVAP
jgi:hypothetical protein